MPGMLIRCYLPQSRGSGMVGVHQWTITSEDTPGQRLDVFLASRLQELSRSRARDLIDQGAAKVNGVAVKPKVVLRPGDAITLEIPEPVPAGIEPEAMDLSILFEDEAILVVDKPPGLVVHPGAGNPGGTLVNALLHHCQGQLSGIGGVERPGIVHRLDKETSGCLVVAKTDEAHRELSRQFADRETGKIYLAVVEGRPKADEGRIEARLGRHPVDRQRMTVLPEPHGREATTLWKVLSVVERCTFLRCRILTGRTHQIRVHLKECLRCPIVGDDIYGNKKSSGTGRLMLHSWRLTVKHPVTGRALTFVAPIPDAFSPWVKAAGESGDHALGIID